MPETTEEQGTEFTGERVIPGRVDPALWNEHVSRYHLAATFASGGRILDVGCGAGYGTALLAAAGGKAIGFDIARDAIEYARANNGGNVEFLLASAETFPIRTGSIRTVTAFEVIEHITGWQALIAEAARVLEEDGIFLVSTPNKTYYAETRKESGPNPFHVHEFEYDEFRRVLAEHFPHVQMMAQNRQEAFVFSGEDAPCQLHGIMGSTSATADAHFFIAVCTKKHLSVNPFAFVPQTGNLLRERELHIAGLQQELLFVREQQRELLKQHEELGRELEQHNAWAISLDQELGEARQKIAAEQENAKNLAEWAKRTNHELQEKSAELKNAYALLQEAEDRIRERTEWALRLEQEVGHRSTELSDRTRELKSVNEQIANLKRHFGNLSTHTANLNQKNVENQSAAGYAIKPGGNPIDTFNRLLEERRLLQQSRWLKLGRRLGIGPKLDEDLV